MTDKDNVALSSTDGNSCRSSEDGSTNVRSFWDLDKFGSRDEVKNRNCYSGTFIHTQSSSLSFTIPTQAQQLVGLTPTA